MMTCREVTKKISSSEDIGIIKKIEIKLHLALCKMCQRYYKHIITLQNSFKHLMNSKFNKSATDKIKIDILNKISKLKE